MQSQDSKIDNKSMKKLNSYRWVVWIILAMMYVFVTFHRMSTGVLRSDLMESFNIGDTEFSTIGAMFTWAYFVMQLPSGILADKIGPKKTVTIFTIIASIGSILFGLSSNVYMAYITRFIVGIGVSVVFISIIKIQSKWFPSSMAAFMVGMIGVGANIGAIIAQAPLVILSDNIGWRMTFIVLGSVMLIFTALTFLFVKDTPAAMGLPTMEMIENRPPQSTQPIKISFALSEILKSKHTWIVSIIYCGIYTGYIMLLGVYGTRYLSVRYEIDTISAANYVTAAIIGALISGLVIGALSDRFKTRKKILASTSILTFLCWICFIYVKMDMLVLYAFMVVFGFVISSFTLCWTMGGEYNNKIFAGMATGVMNSVGYFVAAMVPTLMGRIIDSHTDNKLLGLQSAFMIIIVLSGISATLSLISKETNARNIYEELKKK